MGKPTKGSNGDADLPGQEAGSKKCLCPNVCPCIAQEWRWWWWWATFEQGVARISVRLARGRPQENSLGCDLPPTAAAPWAQWAVSQVHCRSASNWPVTAPTVHCQTI